MAEPRVLIAGPGRAGTSVLVKIIDELGVDTTASIGGWFPDARAGGEARLDLVSSPRVVKDPTLTGQLPHLLDSGVVTAGDIAHVLIPIRDLNDAAASRWQNSRRARLTRTAGGLSGVVRATRQAQHLARELWGLIVALEDHDVPYRLMHYPRFMADGGYFVEAVAPALPDVDPAVIAATWGRHTGKEVRVGLSTPGLVDDARALWWEVRRRLYPLAERVGLR